MNQKDTCEIYCFDVEKVKRVQKDLRAVNLSDSALLLKAIADESRAKISYALSREEELCVCDLANIIGATVANTSQHLRKLHKQGIVKYRKEGKLAFYSLSDVRIKEIMNVVLKQQEPVEVKTT